MRAAPFAASIVEALEDHPVVGPLAPAGHPLCLGAAERARAVALVNAAIDYAKTALSDQRRGRAAMVHDDIVDQLHFLSNLRDILSPDPAMERPIGDEILQEWMR